MNGGTDALTTSFWCALSLRGNICTSCAWDRCLPLHFMLARSREHRSSLSLSSFPFLVPCGRLSWLAVRAFQHTRRNVSYCVVSQAMTTEIHVRLTIADYVVVSSVCLCPSCGHIKIRRYITRPRYFQHEPLCQISRVRGHFISERTHRRTYNGQTASTSSTTKW